MYRYTNTIVAVRHQHQIWEYHSCTKRTAQGMIFNWF